MNINRMAACSVFSTSSMGLGVKRPSTWAVPME